MNIVRMSELTDPIVDVTSVTSIRVPTKGKCNIRIFEIMISKRVKDIITIMKEHQFKKWCRILQPPVQEEWQYDMMVASVDVIRVELCNAVILDRERGKNDLSTFLILPPAEISRPFTKLVHWLFPQASTFGWFRRKIFRKETNEFRVFLMQEMWSFVGDLHSYREVVSVISSKIMPAQIQWVMEMYVRLCIHVSNTIRV